MGTTSTNMSDSDEWRSGDFSTITFKSFNFPDHGMRHQNFEGFLHPIEGDGIPDDFAFVLCKGNADRQKVSFQSVNFPGHYLRHQNFRIFLHERDGSDLFDADSTFEFVSPNCGDAEGYGFFSFRSVNFPDRYLRHKNFELWLDENDGSDLFDQDTTFSLFGDCVRFKSYNFRDKSMRHCNFEGFLHDTEDNDDFYFNIRPGNWRGYGISMESVNFPGHFLRHQGFRVYLHEYEDSELYQMDSTFIFDEPPRGRKKGYVAFQSVNYPEKNLRHKNFEMWLEDYGEGPDEDFCWKLKKD